MDRSDVDHHRCATLVEDADEPIIVPAPVIVEIDWLARRGLGTAAFLSLLSDTEDGRLNVAHLQPADYARARELIDRYQDLPLGFVDSTVVAVVERLGETKLATLDCRHFTVVRPRHVPALRLLP